MADTEAKKILTGLWADSGDRTDPDDTSLTPSLDRDDGWTSSFSASNGETPRRKVVNQRFRELDGAASDAMRYGGVYPYDAEINYFQHARCSVGAVEYRATVANGPATSNATNPTTSSQTVWVAVTGILSVPSKPSPPQATAPRSGELDWFWACPRDGGAVVAAFAFQWRVAGTVTWSASLTPAFARQPLTSLTNGQSIEARVQATNSVGTSEWSDVGTATPAGTIPGGGSTLALRATAGDGQVSLDWLEPDDGGVTISSYLVQWRTSVQSFSVGRQATSSDTAQTVSTGINNGTEYFFHVRAVNSEGNGAWSNEASATPVAVVVAPTPTPNTAPNAPPGLRGTPRRPLIVDWDWEIVSDDGGESDGGETILDYTVQWRYQGAGWSGNTTTTDRASLRVTVADTSKGVQARVRARNSVGVSAWSSTATVGSGDLLGAFPQSVRVSSDQTYSWPYADAARAILRLHAETRGVGFDANRNINLGTGTWNGATTDGTTLWLIRSSTAVAYVAATQARDMGRDISLGTGLWHGATTDGTTLWFVDTNLDMAEAYVAATQARDMGRDIDLGNGEWIGATTDGTTLWFVNTFSDTAVAYVAATQARDMGRDIDLGTGTWRGAASVGTTLWFISDTSDTAVAYVAATQARDMGRDIDLGTGYWDGAASDGTTLWFINDTTNTAVAYVFSDPTTLTVNGVTYTTFGGTDLWQPVTGLTQNEGLTIDVDTGGYVDIYPQA